jgi:protein involved in polysaccharide export with SLBB domain
MRGWQNDDMRHFSVVGVVCILVLLAWLSDVDRTSGRPSNLSTSSAPSSQAAGVRLIAIGDHIKISIFDVDGENTGEKIFNLNVPADGKIKLLYVANITAAQKSCDQLAVDISNAYNQANLIRWARVQIWFADTTKPKEGTGQQNSN